MMTDIDRGHYQFIVRNVSHAGELNHYRAELAPDYSKAFDITNMQKPCAETYNYGIGKTPFSAIIALCEAEIKENE